MPYVYSVPGRLIRDPVTRDLLTSAGREVPEIDFWIRRLDDGDVSLTPPLVATLTAQREEVVEVAEAEVAVRDVATARKR